MSIHAAHVVILLLRATNRSSKIVYKRPTYRILILLITWMRIWCSCLLFNNFWRLWTSSRNCISYRNVRNLDIAIISTYLVLGVKAVRASLSVLGSGGTSWSYRRVVIVHYHFGFQRLINNMCITTRTTSTNMHILTLLAIATHLSLLETATTLISTHHGVRLMVRIRHIIMFLFCDGFATVRSYRASRSAVYHTIRVAGIRKRVVGAILIMHRFILWWFEACMNALRHHLIERTTNLLLRLIIVNHTLSMCLTRCTQVILVVAAVPGSTLRQYRILQPLMIGHRLHEIVVLRW